MKKSVFSNGVEDLYKGKRDVQFGWMIVKLDGSEIYAMGHSLDRQKAEKTARGNLPKVHAYYKGRNGAFERAYLAKQWGCTNQQAVAKADQLNAEKQAEYKIEIVELVDA